MLDQRRRRWAGVVQMLYKCYVFAGLQVTDHVISDLHHINPFRENNQGRHLKKAAKTQHLLYLYFVFFAPKAASEYRLQQHIHGRWMWLKPIEIIFMQTNAMNFELFS